MQQGLIGVQIIALKLKQPNFSFFTQSPKYFPQAVLQEKRAGEKKESTINMWEKWIWILLTPIFSTSGGMGPTANMVYKRTGKSYQITTVEIGMVKWKFMTK